MANNSSSNKSLIAKNQAILKNYAESNFNALSRGIIVINLLLLETEDFSSLNLDRQLENAEQTVYQPVSYIPEGSFWFKMISLKIQKKHQIDLHTETNGKFTIVFIKDDSIEHFSIYSLTSKNTPANPSSGDS